jgi:choline dehydrogenase
MIAGVQLARRITGAPALREWGARELFPGRWAATPKLLEGFVRANTMTTFHFAGTCSMGTDDRSVVDERLRVRGVEGLRVADASIMPAVPVSALNAPSMLIGYRAASFMLADAPG